MSFYDIKKHVTNVIKKDNWYDKSFGIIIPKDLTDKMGLDHGYINMDELDDFVSLFY